MFLVNIKGKLIRRPKAARDYTLHDPLIETLLPKYLAETP